MNVLQRCVGSVRSSGGVEVNLWVDGPDPDLRELVVGPPSGGVLRLVRADGAWTLVGEIDGAEARLQLDFGAPLLRQRLLDTRAGHSPLARAFGKRHDGVLWDLTAGLGRDAFALAARGFQVEAVERDPVVHLLLADARRRLAALDVPWAAPVAGRVRTWCAEAETWIGTRRETPAAVLLDPMFSVEGRKSRVKKDLALLQQIVPSVMDDGVRLAEALQAWLAGRSDAAGTVVVVKRATQVAPLWPKPERSVSSGGASRFDVHRWPW